MPAADISAVRTEPLNEHTKMSLLELGKKYKRKNDLYRALKFKAQVYLPGEFYCSYEFMQQILTGKKSFFFNNAVCR